MPRNTSLLLSGVVFWMASSFIYAFPLATFGVHTKSGSFPLGRLFFWILLQTSLTSNTLAVSALPQCNEYDTTTWELITCTSVTISELNDGYLISRGMDGYSADESVIIDLDSGPGTLSFTDFNTEEYNDYVYIGTNANYVDYYYTFDEWFSFTGSSQPSDIDIFGFTSISWSSLSAKGAGFGWVFTFTSNPNITSTTATTTTTTTITISTMTITTATITTTTTLLHFSFDVSSTSCKVDVEEECIQNPDFPSMTNASEILCTGQTNLALYSTAFQTDGDASLTMYDMYNPWGDDTAKLWFSDFPGRWVNWLSPYQICLRIDFQSLCTTETTETFCTDIGTEWISSPEGPQGEMVIHHLQVGGSGGLLAFQLCTLRHTLFI